MTWKRILVPHDFSSGADAALDAASDLASLCDAQVVLVHVTALPGGMHPETLVRPHGDDAPTRADELACESALHRLAPLRDRLEARGISVEARGAVGEIAPTILSLAQDIGADVIVMGTHARSGLAHFFLGSTAEQVIRQSPLPVLTVRVTGEPVPTAAEQMLDDEQAG